MELETRVVYNASLPFSLFSGRPHTITIAYQVLYQIVSVFVDDPVSPILYVDTDRRLSSAQSVGQIALFSEAPVRMDSLSHLV